ncbi:MAG: MFS transporter [Chloroflexi bacterium]|nr:MFS transporter [Chloroflexota bacterium]MBV9133854.1 MFS transporter [Chloroflexota bacterium]MBV9895907.1 MFS transporter [Chloroflexota bacterium]
MGVRRPYYGWVLVFTLGVTETISWGVLYYAFTVYLAPMERELGWSRGAMTGAFSLASLLGGVAAIPVGRWLDRHGPRLLMTVGSVIATCLVLAWANTSSLPMLYAVWAAIGLTMSATLYDPAFATANRWFDRHRVQALTVITLMAGFASTIFIPLAGALVQQQGWRQSLITLAIILGVGTIPAHALLLRKGPERTTSAAGTTNVSEAIRSKEFWWLTTAFWLTSLTTVAIGVHLLPYLQDRGYDATFAATLTGSIGAMQVLARLALTPFGNRISPRTLGIGILALQPISIAILLVIKSTPGVLVFVALFGAQRGLATLVRPALIADLYGVARYASIAGVLQFALSLAQAAAPFGAGAAYDGLHSYEPIFWGLVVISAVAVVALLPARRQAAQATV